MHQIIIAIIQGIVEGLTEFVPVSSTGHLIITGHLLGFTGDKAECFEIFIQLGAILAVVVLYTERFTNLFRLKSTKITDVFNKTTGFSGWRGIGLLVITCIPAVIWGVLFHKIMKTYLFSPVPVLIALVVGAIGIILAERFLPKSKTESLDDITWKQALTVGLFQCISLWPGMSRAACTIIGGMLGRMNRKTSAEYSFLAAVPIMVAASAKELWSSRELLVREDIPIFAVGFIVSFIVAAIAIKTFIQFLQKWTLVPFAVYRLIFAGIFGILIFLKVVKF
jgi:undecaprenyl-diphosphatase